MDEQITNLQQLITSVNTIVTINNKAKEAAIKRGERFNIFKVCRITDKEVLLHSRLIAALLNPEGAHGLGELFLMSFLRDVIDDEFNFNVNSAKVYTEKDIGPVTDRSGGQIDILVQDDKGNIIVIENKIYAEDQKNQLVRYYNYAKENSNNFRLIYLTLDGHEPSKESLGKEGIVYHIASYRDHILRWLEDCAKESYDKPLIRETLAQYISVIKQLTNQDMETDIKKEMIDILSRTENIDALFAISSMRDAVIKRIWSEVFKQQLAETFQQQNPPRYQVDHFGNIFDKWCGINFLVDGWSNFKMRIEFESSGCVDLIYGIVYKDGYKTSKAVGGPTDKVLRDSPYKHSQVWPIWKRFDKYSGWTNASTVKAVYTGEFTKYVVEKLDEIYNWAKDIEGM